MGNLFSESSKNFHWEYTESPHAGRRVEMLKKHPQLKKLMKNNGDPQMAVIGLIFVFLQFALAFFNFHLPFVPMAMFLSLTVGSWLASGIFLQIHEACHGLTFGPNSVWKNRIFGFILNLPLGFPVFAFFKKHHKIHHKYQGESDLDVEYATESELKYFKGSLGKYSWIMLNPYLQLWRAIASKNTNKPPDFNVEDALSIITVAVFDLFLIFNGYGYMLFLMYVSNFTALATNIVGFWGISVHTEFFHMEETRNYYGWQNYFFMNFGYHVEHHDFPNIPGRYLPKIKHIAPEFYEDFYIFDSVYTPIIKFVYDPKYGVFSRLKHNSR